MIEQMETEVRAALAARADEIPATVAGRVAGRGYRPRTRDLRPPVAAGALVAAGVAAGVVLIVGLGPRTPEAFAGWTATPTTPVGGQTSAAEAGCSRRLAGLPAPPGARTIPQPPKDTAGMSPVLTDTRGPFTFVIFAGAKSSATCISGPSFTAVSSAGSSVARPAVPAAQIALSSTSHTARDGDAYSFAEGRTGPGVTAATLVLADGSRVQASSANGWFVAWWPGSSSVVSADVTTAQGTSTQRLPGGTGCPPPAGPGTGCASGFGGGPGAQSGSISLSGSGG